MDSVVDFILKADLDLAGGKDTLAAFLDVEGAYDNVRSDIFLNKLASIGCSGKIVKFVSFLTH